jgi:hypothetical protein
VLYGAQFVPGLESTTSAAGPEAAR